MRRIARLLCATVVAAWSTAGHSRAQEPAPAEAVTPAGGIFHRSSADCPCPPAPYPCPPVGPSTNLLTNPTGVTAGEPVPSFAGSFAAAGPGATTAVNPGAYIDGAIPANMIRLRYDAAYGNNRPDRAEFFYPKCGCFATLPPGTAGFDPHAKGPPLPETSVDYQDIATYLEGKLTERVSVFGEIPVRFINPEQNANTSGLGDVSFGFKYAAILTDDRVLTLQLRTTTPSGDGFKGLGQENWRVEPGVLWQNNATEQLTFFGEVKDSIPVSRASDFAGNVIEYGIGSAYLIPVSQGLRVMPVVEWVGWTCLSGREVVDPASGASKSAKGDTIVNVKAGLRFGFGQIDEPGSIGRSDLYIGYGRALTGEVWYKDILRVEYRYWY
jgi:hypothetical protein